MTHTCRSLIKDYCAHCSFAGIHYIADDTKHWLERVVWAILVFLAWYGVSLLIIAAWDSFQENPISFGVETTYLDWETKLPAVAVCELANIDKVYEVADTIWPPDHLLELEDALKEIAYFRGVSYTLVETCHTAKNPNVLCPKSNYSYYANLVRSDCPKIMRNCSYNGNKFDCCEYFQAIDTDLGQCFILNSIQTKDPKPYEMVCNRTHKSGIIKFEILLTAMVYTISEDEVPTITTLQSSTLKIQMKHTYSRRITVRNIENDRLVTSETSIEQRACRTNDENDDGLYPHYSYSACTIRCRKLEQMKACGCNDHFMISTTEDQLCNLTGMACLHSHATQLTTLKPKWATRPGLACNCLPSCRETEITVINDIVRTNRTLKKRAEVEIVLEYLPTERFKRRVVRSHLDLVVSVGGTTGLFVGASILSFVELLFYFTVRFVNNILMYRRGFEKKKNVKIIVKRKRVNASAVKLKVIKDPQIQGPYASSGVFHTKLVACDNVKNRGYLLQ